MRVARSQLVAAGETVVLARAGKPVARIVRLEKKQGMKLGVLKGKLPKKLLDDAIKPLSRRQIETLFGGALEP